MKVCFLSSARYRQPLDATSAKKFRALGTLGEMVVIGFSCDLTPRRFTEQAEFYLLPLFPFPILRYLTMFTIAPGLAFWLIFRQRLHILVAQSPYEGFAAALAKKMARWFGRHVALVVESHGDFERDVFLQRRIVFARLWRFGMRVIARFTLAQADGLRAISASTKAQLARWQPGCPVFQMMAWTDMAAFLNASAQRPAPPSPMFLYAGVLIPRKGVAHLIKAFAALTADFPQARLVLLGKEQDGPYVQELKAQLKSLGLADKVRFVPEMPQEQLAGWMAQACAFVLPSLSEGLGRVVVEAMATGAPVIGSRVGGIPDLIHDQVTGFLVAPGDEAALAEKMRWILAHPALAQTMGQQAQNFARAFFSTETYVQSYQQIFQAAEMSLKNKNTPHAPSPV